MIAALLAPLSSGVLGAGSPIVAPSVDWQAIAPVLTLGGAAVLVVLSRALLRHHRVAMPVALVITAVGLIATGAMLAWQWCTVRDLSLIHI